MIEVKEEFLRCDKLKRAVRSSGASVIGVWLALKAYAAEHLTDGFIPSEDVDAVDALGDAYVDVDTRRKCIVSLIECGRLRPDGGRGPGLLERVEHGYQLHDYLDHAMSADELKRRRGLKAERQKRWRENHANRNVDAVDAERDVYETVSETSTRRCGDASPARPRAPVPNPTQPVDQRETDPSDPSSLEDPDSGSLVADPDPDPPVRSGSREDAYSGEQAVFDHWRSVHGHPNAKLDSKRRARIRARMREGFTNEQLFDALEGAKFDRFLMGEDKNSSRVYDGIETLLRDRAQVERLIELKRSPQSPKARGTEDAFSRQMREIRELEEDQAESKELQEILG
jgi:hypothetical protein